ncbi:MAG: histidine phosphatase family protein [Planctomycetaceae bacterium]|nr:histidine phosphatase family protein [Planctomycetaceae bacterium]
MKTLLLLRHGKSSWKDTSLSDHDRPLKKRGREAAQRMGCLLRELDLVPDHLLTSSAVRALETVQFATKAAEYQGDIETVPALYHADPRSLAAIVSHVPDRFASVLIVGHNPGQEEWLARLIGRHETLPTATLAQVELTLDSWRDITPDTRGELKGLWRPSQFDSSH